MSRTRLAVALAIAALGLVGGISAAEPFPKKIPLPNGFQPEGIAITGKTFYVGSIPTGAIYRGDLRTGTGRVYVPPRENRAAIGLAIRERLLFVAGGPTGRAWVYDTRTGEDVAKYRLTSKTTFVNDVVATRTAAWFTDSLNPVLYHVPIHNDGTLGPQHTFRRVPLRGDIRYEDGFNVNGIDATLNGRKLVIVQSNTGLLFTVDPDTGRTKLIDLGGELVQNGDGILLDGRTLYVVQNRNNVIAVIRLNADMSAGTITARITDPDFDVPTTIDDFGTRLYAVNARFGTPPGPDTEYWVTQVQKP